MDYNEYLKAEDIPTIRRLDYIVENTDGFESGKLYAALRNLITLNDFRSSYKTEKTLNEEFNRMKKVYVPKLEWVNQWMKAHNKEAIFTDVNSWKDIGEDYDYFWNLRTEEDFIKEEAEARLEISGRKPIENGLEKYEDKIKMVVEKLKDAPSLDEK